MITIDDQIECALREIDMRKRVYPRLVKRGKMKPISAEREIQTMEAVLETLEKWRDGDFPRGFFG